MNKLLPSLCLFGAALYIGNTLTSPSSKSPARGVEVTLDVSRPQSGAVSAPQAKSTQGHKAATRRPAPQDVPVTGSIGGQAAKTEAQNGKAPAPVSRGQLAEVGGEPPKIGGASAEWAEVVLAAKMHNAPSVSAPIVWYYPVGTDLRLIQRQAGWIKVAEPATSRQGWIYEKYLMPKERPHQTQTGIATASPPSATAASEMTNAVSTAVQPKPSARSKKVQTQRNPQSAIGFAFRIYPW
jgi:hypothetical protein